MCEPWCRVQSTTECMSMCEPWWRIRLLDGRRRLTAPPVAAAEAGVELINVVLRGYGHVRRTHLQCAHSDTRSAVHTVPRRQWGVGSGQWAVGTEWRGREGTVCAVGGLAHERQAVLAKEAFPRLRGVQCDARSAQVRDVGKGQDLSRAVCEAVEPPGWGPMGCEAVEPRVV
jgi:hypothetical protein